MEQQTKTSARALGAALKPRQLTMMGLGSAIGAGLFIGSGAGIQAAGPAVLISYLVAGTLIILVMWALGVVQRDTDRPGACQLHQDGVRLEGAPREHHLIPGVAESGDDLLQDAHTAGSHCHLFGGDAQVPGNPFAEFDGGHVRVAVHPARRFGHRGDGCGQRLVVAFVAGEGCDIHAGAAPARDVGRKAGDGATKGGQRGLRLGQELISGHEVRS